LIGSSQRFGFMARWNDRLARYPCGIDAAQVQTREHLPRELSHPLLHVGTLYLG